MDLHNITYVQFRACMHHFSLLRSFFTHFLDTFFHNIMLKQGKYNISLNVTWYGLQTWKNISVHFFSQFKNVFFSARIFWRKNVLPQKSTPARTTTNPTHFFWRCMYNNAFYFFLLLDNHDHHGHTCNYPSHLLFCPCELWSEPSELTIFLPCFFSFFSSLSTQHNR